MCLYRWLWEETQILRILSGLNTKTTTRTTKNRLIRECYSWKTILSLNLSTHTKNNHHRIWARWTYLSFCSGGMSAARLTVEWNPQKATIETGWWPQYTWARESSHILTQSHQQYTETSRRLRSTPAIHRLSAKGTNFLNPHSQEEDPPRTPAVPQGVRFSGSSEHTSEFTRAWASGGRWHSEPDPGLLSFDADENLKNNDRGSHPARGKIKVRKGKTKWKPKWRLSCGQWLSSVLH